MSSQNNSVKMVYEWEDKEAECYQLYVEERKSLDEVMQHMKDVHNFNPRSVFRAPYKGGMHTDAGNVEMMKRTGLTMPAGSNPSFIHSFIHSVAAFELLRAIALLIYLLMPSLQQTCISDAVSRE